MHTFVDYQRRRTCNHQVLVGNFVGNSVGNFVGNPTNIQLTERQCVIIDIVKTNGNVTAKTLVVTLAVSARTIERELNFLRKEGYLTKEGNSNKGVWKVLK